METQKDAPPVRENSDVGRLLRAYVEAYPGKVGGEADGKLYGFKYHTQSQRSGDLTKRGFPTIGTKRKGEDYKEYRFNGPLVFDRARLLVRAWAGGSPERKGLEMETTEGTTKGLTFTQDSPSRQWTPARGGSFWGWLPKSMVHKRL